MWNGTFPDAQRMHTTTTFRTPQHFHKLNAKGELLSITLLLLSSETRLFVQEFTRTRRRESDTREDKEKAVVHFSLMR